MEFAEPEPGGVFAVFERAGQPAVTYGPLGSEPEPEPELEAEP